MQNKQTWFLFLLWTSWNFSSVLFRSVERSKISHASNNSCWGRITSPSSSRAQADEWPTIKLARKLAKKKYSTYPLWHFVTKGLRIGCGWELLRPPMIFSKNIIWILVVLWTVLPSSFPKQSIGFPYLCWKVWTWMMFSRHSGLWIPLSGSTPKLLNQNKSNNRYIILLQYHRIYNVYNDYMII